MLPRKPVTNSNQIEMLQEKFVNGSTVGKSQTEAVGEVKWYNLPIPIEIHAAAKYNAILEGISLAKYYINAISEANARRVNGK